LKLKVTNGQFLIFVIVYCILLIPVYLLTRGIISIILQIPLFIFFPGYVLLSTLFPYKNSFTKKTGIVLSAGTSLGIISLLGLITGFTPWGLNALSIFISTLVFVLIFAIAVLIRFHLMPQDSRPVFVINSNSLIGKFNNNSRLDKTLIAILSAVILIAIGIFSYLIATPVSGEQYAEFYIVPDARGGYPSEATVHKSLDVTLVVVNQENQKEIYRIEVKFDNRIISSETSEELDHAEQWKIPLKLDLDKAGSDQKIEFYLYKGDNSLPYRNKPLWLNIDIYPEY